MMGSFLIVLGEILSWGLGGIWVPVSTQLHICWIQTTEIGPPVNQERLITVEVLIGGRPPREVQLTET